MQNCLQCLNPLDTVSSPDSKVLSAAQGHLNTTIKTRTDKQTNRHKHTLKCALVIRPRGSEICSFLFYLFFFSFSQFLCAHTRRLIEKRIHDVIHLKEASYDQKKKKEDISACAINLSDKIDTCGYVKNMNPGNLLEILSLSLLR